MGAIPKLEFLQPADVADAARIPTLDDHWQDFPGPAVLPTNTAGDVFRASTGLRTIIRMLAISNTKASGLEIDSDGPPPLKSIDVEGLLSASMVLAELIAEEMSDAGTRAWNIVNKRNAKK